MGKPSPQVDVLVLGEHPSAYLTAALLRQAKLKVLHSTIPGEGVVDRLVLINPAFFELHKLLEPLRRKMEMLAVYGLQFLSDDAETRSEHRSKSTTGYVTSYKDVRSALMKIAQDQDVDLVTPKELSIQQLDERGLDASVGGAAVHAKALVVGGVLPEDQQRALGMPDGWGTDIIHRYTFLRWKGTKQIEVGARPTLPMSLDLKGMLSWAWLLTDGRSTQIAVEQPAESVGSVSPLDLLKHWAGVLNRHGVLKTPELPFANAESLDLPLAGALAHEGVANRTLLVGPAGGFCTACAEDIYPNCWSAIHAADAMKKALKETHLQDALNAYRHRWRTTLGDYLRGPQQNLRFLLPLVYRNQVMTTRLTESILLGKSVVR